MYRAWGNAFSALLILAAAGCSPVGPSEEQGPDLSNPLHTKAAIYPVNEGRQVCNPSVSQDTNRYPACMLWLNFSGALNVKTGSFPDYSTASSGMHDRLTISDTSNTVQWYWQKPDSIIGEVQDPEWAAHPEYIVFLLDERKPGTRDEDAVWSGNVIRISDTKEVFRFADTVLHNTSTPHLWLPSETVSTGTVSREEISYSSEGFADKQSVRNYFGTCEVKIVYCLKNSDRIMDLYYIDFSQPNPSPVKLPKPENDSLRNCESALISPDGNWIVYNGYKRGVYNAYLQKLSPDAQPILVGTERLDPHWFVSPTDGSWHIVSCWLENGRFVQDSYTSEKLDGSLGATMIRKTSLPASADFVGIEEVLVRAAFKGGVSPDGKFAATGYGYAFLAKLE